jgi:PII-like signaling protein
VLARSWDLPAAMPRRNPRSRLRNIFAVIPALRLLSTSRLSRVLRARRRSRPLRRVRWAGFGVSPAPTVPSLVAVSDARLAPNEQPAPALGASALSGSGMGRKLGPQSFRRRPRRSTRRSGPRPELELELELELEPTGFQKAGRKEAGAFQADRFSRHQRTQCWVGIVGRGLATLEYTRLATDEDVADATFPGNTRRIGKLTIYCGRPERSHGRLPFRQAVDLLRRYGAGGAIVLMGVDGVLHGRRREARLFGPNADSPMMIISVGPAESLRHTLPALQPSLHNSVVTIEGITQLKHDGELLGLLPGLEDDEDVWHTLRVYTRRSAQVNDRPLYRAYAPAAGGWRRRRDDDPLEAMADAIARGAELRSRDPIRHSLAITRKRGRRMDVEHHPAERRLPQNPLQIR